MRMDLQLFADVDDLELDDLADELKDMGIDLEADDEDGLDVEDGEEDTDDDEDTDEDENEEDDDVPKTVPTVKIGRKTYRLSKNALGKLRKKELVKIADKVEIEVDPDEETNAEIIDAILDAAEDLEEDEPDEKPRRTRKPKDPEPEDEGEDEPEPAPAPAEVSPAVNNMLAHLIAARRAQITSGAVTIKGGQHAKAAALAQLEWVEKAAALLAE